MDLFVSGGTGPAGGSRIRCSPYQRQLESHTRVTGVAVLEMNFTVEYYVEWSFCYDEGWEKVEAVKAVANSPE